MNAFTRTPYRSFDRGLEFLGEFDEIVNGLFNPARDKSTLDRTLTPAIDITETASAYEVRADLPGINKDSLSVSIKDKLLSIEAESNDNKAVKEGETTIKLERRTGKYLRTLKLGNTVDESKISAEYSNGVLKLGLPKAEKTESKKIEIDVQ